MKRYFIVCLLALLASVVLVAAIEYDPGYLLLSYGHYTFESSVWVALAAFLLILLVFYGLFSAFRRIVNSSNQLTGWLYGRGQRRSQRQITRGLISFIEGNWQHSRRILLRGANQSETPLVNYLMAARASHALDDMKQVNENLKRAEQSTHGASIAVGLTQAELQIRSGQFEQSLATLTRVRRNAGKHPYVLYLLQKVYEGLNDWQEVLNLLPELKKYQVLSDQALVQLDLTASKACIIETAKLRNDAGEQLQKLWLGLSKAARKNSDILACYVEQVMMVGANLELEKLIRNQLKNEWNKQLVCLYGKIEMNDPGRQLLHAEGWLQERNNDPALMLCLGRLSLRNSLWGKAREYFENSLKLENSPIVCAELGRLLAHLGEHEKSSAYFQQGLELMSNGLPQLPLPTKQK